MQKRAVWAGVGVPNCRAGGPRLPPGASIALTSLRRSSHALCEDSVAAGIFVGVCGLQLGP
jgi:hypothetical protein